MSAFKTALAVTATLSVPVAMSRLPGPLESGPETADLRVIERHQLTQLGFAGREVYRQHCQSCHGAGGQGTTQGPSLLNKTYRSRDFSAQAIHSTIQNGVEARLWDYGDMPALDLSFNDIELVARYVRELRDPARYGL